MKNKCYAFKSLRDFFDEEVEDSDIIYAIQKWVETADPVFAQVQLDLASDWLTRNKLATES
jgi:hypothetical protein